VRRETEQSAVKIMQTKTQFSTEGADRRQRAEALLREQRPETGAGRQIELEMQNEELQHARDMVEGALEKYSDLYDFAPVGYLTLDREGTVCEANLTSASLLGIERSRLVRRRFGLFVVTTDAPIFNAFLKRIFESKSREFCETTILREGRPAIAVRIEGAMAASGWECRVAVTDITERKRAEEDRLVLSKLECTGILAGGIAHDFNNLLTVILLNLELAQELAPAEGELKRRLQEANQAALASRSLTQQLITLAQGDAPIRKPTALSALIPAGDQEMHLMLAYHMGWVGVTGAPKASGKRLRPLLVLMALARMACWAGVRLVVVMGAIFLWRETRKTPARWARRGRVVKAGRSHLPAREALHRRSHRPLRV